VQQLGRLYFMHVRYFALMDSASHDSCSLQLFYRATNDLENFIYKAVTQDMVVTLVANDPGPATEDAMFGLFAEYVVHNHSAELQSYRSVTTPKCYFYPETVGSGRTIYSCKYATIQDMLATLLM